MSNTESLCLHSMDDFRRDSIRVINAYCSICELLDRGLEKVFVELDEDYLVYGTKHKILIVDRRFFTKRDTSIAWYTIGNVYRNQSHSYNIGRMVTIYNERDIRRKIRKDEEA